MNNLPDATNRAGCSAKAGMVPGESPGRVNGDNLVAPLVPHETPATGCVRPIISGTGTGTTPSLERTGRSRLDLVEIGARRFSLATRLAELRSQGLSLEAAAARAETSIPTAWRLLRLLAELPPENRNAAAFAPRPRGPRRITPLTAEEEQAVKKLLLQSNRDWRSGSLPEALRQASHRGILSPELAADLQAREASGKPLPRPLRRQTRLTEAHVRAFRSPREAWLDYVSSAGSLQFTIDPETGEERLFEPGEQWTLDDGTINLICCVPTTDPQYKHGVMVGRFQFLLIVDHRSYFIPGFSFTARPRGSYRAEDLLALIQTTALEHGLPRRLLLEHGISAANNITRACELAGVEIVRATSPHQKVVELVFGCLWTKLSFLPGQVGRFQGEQEGVAALYESCRRGAKDPRQHFPMLADVLRALREAISDWNGHWVNRSRYGRWQPAEFWQRASARHLRPLHPEDAWIFAPRVTEPLKVRGLGIETSVLFAPGFSQKFTFGADWLVDWIGARVTLHFNPFTGTPAKAVLAEPWRGERAGQLLGDLELFDRQAKFTLRAWGYADLPDDGAAAVHSQAQALHRSIQAIRPDGKPGRTAVEVRDSLNRSTVEPDDLTLQRFNGLTVQRFNGPTTTRHLGVSRPAPDPRLAEFADIPL